MKYVAVLLIIGAALLSYAASLAPYKDEKVFYERYMKLTPGQSKDYGQLRDEMLTNKFQLQDYGGTAILLAFVAFIIGRKGIAGVRAPKTRWPLIALAVIAPVLTTVAYVFDLLQAFARGESPHWADSMVLGLMGAPVQLAILLPWALAHLALLKGQYFTAAPIVYAFSRQSNVWLLFVSGFTGILVAAFVALGQYWYACPALLWVYFYLSLAAVRCAPAVTQPGANAAPSGANG